MKQYCYLTQSVIVTTRTPEEAEQLGRLLDHMPPAGKDFAKDWVWVIIYAIGMYSTTGTSYEYALPTIREQYSLLPVYTFQGFKHHYIK